MLYRALAVALFLPLAAAAQTLTVGLKTEMNGLDPHMHNAPAGHQINRHLFDRLVEFAPGGTDIRPGLAARWEPRDAETMVFHLRPEARFHDGTPVTAADVQASIRRIPGILNNVGPFLPYIRAIAEVDAEGERTVAIRTRGPAPGLLRNLALVSIVPARQAGAAVDAFNTGAAAIGSGPYRFVGYSRNQMLELARNDLWWGERPAWERVRIRFIPNDATRMAALLAGDLDIMNAVGTQDAATVRSDRRATIAEAPSLRIIHFSFDLHRERSNHVTALDGSPLATNPFRDVRVRRAVSGSIQRAALAERMLNGFARPVGQMASEETFGHVPGLNAESLSPEQARALLRDAGYPDGFGLTIHVPADFIPSGPQIGQAAAQMLARIGIRAQVTSIPAASFFPGARQPDGPAYSLWLTSWGNNGGDSVDALSALMHTPDAAAGLGAQNIARASVPAADALIRAAATELDDAKRLAAQQQAMRLLMEQHVQAPILVQTAIFAMRPGLAYTPNPQDHFHAHEVRAAR
jgi:peptide/nickel transport system substrate-binding protein